MGNTKSKSTKKPTLKSQIEALELSVKEENDKFLRLFAEFENYKKRTSKERLDLYKTASQELMTALLPIIDDLNRASTEFEKSKEKSLVEGFSLIKNKFSDTLQSQGLILIDVKKGDDFDVWHKEKVTINTCLVHDWCDKRCKSCKISCLDVKFISWYYFHNGDWH